MKETIFSILDSVAELEIESIGAKQKVKELDTKINMIMEHFGLEKQTILVSKKTAGSTKKS